MLGSNPTRDSRMRRHHADGEGGRNTVFPFFILMLSPYALKNPFKKWSEATSLPISQKIVEPIQFNQEILFRLI